MVDDSQKFMRASDAFTWYMERDPTLRSTVVAVVWLDRAPDWDRFLARLERATRLVPAFRQRVVEPPARLATPRWTVDDGFDLSWHARRVGSTAPHTPETVMAIARNAAMTAFDPARPLWEFTLVDGLEGGQAALVMKLHHSLTDGIGGMQLMLTLFDAVPEPAEAELTAAPGDEPDAAAAPAPPVPAGERLGPAALVRESLVRSFTQGVGFARGAAGSVVPTAARATRRPLATVGDAVRTACSVGRTVAPVRTTLSPVMTERGLTRHLELLEVELDDLKRAAAAAGGSVNDGFLAAVSGGLRRYHDHHGAPVDRLRVTLPISIRKPADPLGGNRITLIRFAVPVADADPASRVRAMARLCRSARHERSLPLTDAIAGTLNLLPPSVVGGMLKHVDFVASDVPGFTFPVSLAGARVRRYVAFGPTIGTALNLTLLSYQGTCCIGVTIDAAAVPDADVLAECLREGFEEVLDLAAAHAPVRRPFRTVEPATVPPATVPPAVHSPTDLPTEVLEPAWSA